MASTWGGSWKAAPTIARLFAGWGMAWGNSWSQVTATTQDSWGDSWGAADVTPSPETPSAGGGNTRRYFTPRPIVLQRTKDEEFLLLLQR